MSSCQSLLNKAHPTADMHLNNWDSYLPHTSTRCSNYKRLINDLSRLYSNLTEKNSVCTNYTGILCWSSSAVLELKLNSQRFLKPNIVSAVVSHSAQCRIMCESSAPPPATLSQWSYTAYGDSHTLYLTQVNTEIADTKHTPDHHEYLPEQVHLQIIRTHSVCNRKLSEDIYCFAISQRGLSSQKISQSKPYK